MIDSINPSGRPSEILDADFQNLLSADLKCSICSRSARLEETNAFATFPCNVRAFWKEPFQIWKCSQCNTIHCLNQVDLSKYYAQYPYAEAILNLPFQLYYRKLCKQLSNWHISKQSIILDYGCGNGLLIKYLQQKGFENAYGYDPYGAADSYGDKTTLEHAPFEYIILQDVIEHVDEPEQLLAEIDGLLAKGGYVFIGTPNAQKIDLTHPELSDYYNPVHVPYHRHIYTPETLTKLVQPWGWKLCKFYDRSYSDTRWFSLNTRAWNHYQRLLDGTLDSLFDPINVNKALASPKFWWYALFGYWQSLSTEMSILFQK